MYFKKLEIFGFKSFAEKTVLNFEPGITAVVGPNGCGKSNIFDSIRWVLGEQSVKELRGASMEDVIFNGTDKKPALGFAEVSLTFSNENHHFPVDYNEVTITRRLYRSGESEYLMNKTTVRLKDILELLMGTGIGAEAYSLVQQGRVDLVVSAKPDERRMIFDEAAGITKYKSKKREALGKLKETEENLLRINDITVEVKRQIASIERQANKARRYKEEFERLKTFEIRLAQAQIESFSAEKAQIAQLLEALQEQEQKFTGELQGFREILAGENDNLFDLEQKVNEIHSEEVKLANQIEIDTRQVAFNEERIENIQETEERLAQQKNQLAERGRVQQGKIDQLKAELLTLTETMQKSLVLLDEKKEALKNIAHAIAAAKDTIKHDEEKILELTSRQVRMKNELTEIMKEFQGALARKRRLEMENVKVCAEKEDIDNKLRGVNEDISRISATVGELKMEQDAQGQILAQLKETLAVLEQKIDELEKKKLFLISQKEFIEELRVQYQDIPNPIVEGRLIMTTSPLERHTGIIGKVKEVLAVDPAKYPALQPAAPGPDAKLYEVICETKFIELDPQAITSRIESVAQEILVETGHREELNIRIKNQEEVIAQVVQAALTQERSLSILEAQKKDVLEEVNKLQGELDLVGSEIAEVKEILTTLKTSEDDFSRQLNASNEELVWCQSNIKEKQDLIATRSLEREETAILITQLETELESDKDKEKSQQETLKMFSDALAADLAEIQKIDEETGAQEGRKQKIGEEIIGLQSKIETLLSKKDSLKGVLSEAEKQKAEVTQKINGIKRNISSYEKEIEEMKDTLHKQQLKSQEMAFNEKTIKDRLLQTYRIDLDEVLAQMKAAAQQPPAAVETAITSENPAEQSVPDGQLPTAEAGAAEGEAPAQPELLFVSPSQQQLFEQPMSREELEEEIGRLRKRCESYGMVNLVAIEEFDELRQRFEFLTKQQSDLLTARDSLHQTISKINRTTRQMFMETFTKVSEEFRIYFRMLFGGGEAQLVLMDPENVLESGIEIVARPPGKKLQSISLLSGGEKTLTAIALIFGVFKVRPSPFCVLDEIDAALDESNVGRFGYLLKDFSKIAQFIVVTHNKKTIANADVMYGITMQETGVSKIVSVKFADKDKKPQAEAVEVGV